MQVEKLSGNPKPLDILAKINQIIDNMVVSVNGSGADGNGNINVATIPVGFNYVQYPGESAPADLFGGEWENISAQFAGQFFRAEGGNAAEFGGSQTHALPNITGTIGGILMSNWQEHTGAFGVRDSGVNNYNGGNGLAGAYDFYASRSSGVYGAAEEVRPHNSTVRIWKRTA